MDASPLPLAPQPLTGRLRSCRGNYIVLRTTLSARQCAANRDVHVLRSNFLPST